jgi:charged multivesicular body protein 3
MTSMSKLVSMPQVAAVARSLAQEMAKAGVIDEMVDEAFSATDSEEVESEADAAIDAVIAEVTEGEFSGVAKIDNNLDKHRVAAAAARQTKEEKIAEVENDKELDEMKDRLQKLGAGS